MSSTSTSGRSRVNISTASVPEAVGRTVIPAPCSASRTMPRSSSSSSQKPIVGVTGPPLIARW